MPDAAPVISTTAPSDMRDLPPQVIQHRAKQREIVGRRQAVVAVLDEDQPDVRARQPFGEFKRKQIVSLVGNAIFVRNRKALQSVARC